MRRHTVIITPEKGLTLTVEGEYYPFRMGTMQQPNEYSEFNIKFVDIVEGNVTYLIQWVSDQKDVWEVLQDLCIDEIEKQQP